MSKGLKRVLQILWATFGLGVLATLAVFLLISTGVIGYMPPIEDLQNPIDKYASQLISEDNVTLGTFARANNNRLYVTYDQLSPKLVQALIATEDKRFIDHSGIDVRGVYRALFKTVVLGDKSSGGGSTITQQLAKQLYSPKANSIWERALQKPIEWVIATKLERFYTKEEIITLYLNQFDFLYQAVGIESAALTYFSSTPKKLKTEDAALLVGMAKNPSLYNPKRFPERSRDRRNVVLDLMADQHYLTRSEADSLKSLPVTLKFNRQSHRDGLAPYFREYIRTIMMAEKPRKSDYRGWQIEDYKRDLYEWENNPLYGWCHKNKKNNGEFYDIYTDGLKIYTTINARMQAHAEDAMAEHLGGYLQPAFDREKKGRKYAPFSSKITLDERSELIERSIKLSDRYRTMRESGASELEIAKSFDTPVEMTVFTYGKNGEKLQKDTLMTPKDSILYHKSFLRSGFMAMDVQTGEVRAYVGGVDYKTFQYDMVTQGRRQVGSVMKPYLYAMAMNEGFTPCDQVMHVQPHIRTESGSIWTPRNAGAKRVGEMVTIEWGLQNSSNWVTAWLMSQMSPYAFVDLLHSFGITGEMDPVMSICLGTHDISVKEMVSGFSTFATAGIRAEPIYVTHIEDQYGNVVAEFTGRHIEVLPAEASYKTLHMLRSVLNGGTGSRMRFRYNITTDMGGKTGTTQNQSDGWFMCFTPRLSTGCWVGGEDRSIHFDGMAMGQGANTALPIVAKFFQKVYNDKELEKRANSLGIGKDLKFGIPPEYQDPCKQSAGEHNDHLPVQQGIDDLFN